MRSLADEARAAIGARGAGDPSTGRAARRVLAARSRLLPYLVAGAAFTCTMLGLVTANVAERTPEVIVGIAAAAGFVAGTVVGWVLLGLGSRFFERSHGLGRGLDLAIVALTIPAYLLAGFVSAWTSWIAAITLTEPVPAPGAPDPLPLLLGAAVVVYPLSYVFAKRDLDRPDTLTGAVQGGLRELEDSPSTWSLFTAAAIAIGWVVGALLAVLAILALLQAVLPGYQAAVRNAGAGLPIALLVAWIGLAVGGTIRTRRWMARRRSNRG